MNAELPDADYVALLELRTGLRRFLRWSADRAQEAGLTPSQHQLLLAIRGLTSTADLGPTVGDVAEQLLLRHHSAVGLVDRAADEGLVERVRDERDQRVVRLVLTNEGRRRLPELSTQHRGELARVGPQLAALWEGLDVGRGA